MKFEDQKQNPKKVVEIYYQKRDMSGKKIDLEKRINSVIRDKYKNYLQMILDSLKDYSVM